MNIQFSYKNLTENEKKQIIEYMNDKVRRIEKWARGESSLVVRAEKFKKKAAFNIELIYTAPGSRRLISSEDDHTVREAIDFAVDKLVRQMEKMRETKKPSHHKYPRRISIRERWDTLESSVFLQKETTDAEQAQFFKALTPLVKPAIAMIRHELSNAGLGGDADGATAETIVNDAVVRLWDERHSPPSSVRLQQWFYRTALGLANERIKQASTSSATLSMDRELSLESEASRVSNLGDEVKDFWQPDDILTIADVIEERKGKGLTSSQKKQYRQLLRSLVYLRPPARQAFLLRYREGFQPDEIALIQRRAVRAVEKDLKDAITTLKRKVRGGESEV